LHYYKYRHYIPRLGRDPLGDEAFLQKYAEDCNKDVACWRKRRLKLKKLTAEGQRNIYLFVDNKSLNNFDIIGLKL